jgi:molybdate transport system substrate-binding protein
VAIRFPSRLALRCAAGLLAGLLAVAAPTLGRAAEATIFAAASTTNAISEIAALFEAQGEGRIVASFASSSILAKQIENGAPADIFVSANPRWMDYLEARGLVVPGSRRDLAGNRLVLIAPHDEAHDIEIGPELDLLDLLGRDRLAIGDPDHVPAGIYGRQALETLGLWRTVAQRLARAADVRAALVMVERGDTPLGIVYASDAAMSPRVRVVGRFPAELHPPIHYPAALVAGRDSPLAQSFFTFLGGAEARAVFARHGFTVP